MSGLDNSAITHYKPIFRHCLGRKTAKIRYPGTINTLERKKELRSSFLSSVGNLSAIQIVRTLNIFDWPISNSSNTPISNYFLTVRTKEEFTVMQLPFVLFQRLRSLQYFIILRRLYDSFQVGQNALFWDFFYDKSGIEIRGCPLAPT